MAKVHLQLPQNWLFSTEIPIRITDINYGNHLGNDALLSILHEARMQFFSNLTGGTELNMIDGIGIIIYDCAISYKSEGFYGNILKTNIGINELTEIGFELLYQVINLSTQKTLAEAKHGIVCFDYQARKKAKVPALLKEKLLGIKNI
jgi:acyl-CoA thioesterase FadM